MRPHLGRTVRVGSTVSNGSRDRSTLPRVVVAGPTVRVQAASARLDSGNRAAVSESTAAVTPPFP